MKQHYIFTISIDPLTSERRPAAEVLAEAERRGTWIVSARTRHIGELRADDEVLFYVAGAHQVEAKHVIATARIADRATPMVNQQPGSWIGLSTPRLYEIPIRELVRLSKAIPLQLLVDDLGFIRNKDSWGSTLMGRITKIPADDYRVILASDRKYMSQPSSSY